MSAIAESPAPASVEDLVGRLFESTAAAMDILSVYLGEQLGYYRALHEGGPATSSELAARTGTHERYAREWLEQQATTGFLAVADVAAPAAERRFSLPEGYEEVFVNPLSEAFLAPVGRFFVASAMQAEPLLDAYRSGTGVSWTDFGDAARSAQADFNRPFFTHSLVPGFISQIPGVDEALKRPGAHVAEIGFGGGWASIAIAKAYPDAKVDGYDIDGPSVEMARKNAAEAGAADNVAFHHRDAGEAGIDGQCDLVCAFECVHDMPDPVAVLRTMRRLVKPGGSVVIMDEKVADEFGAIGDLNERFFYGFSIAVCLPDGMSHQPSRATGTVMRTSTLTGYALEAGFSEVEVLPLDGGLFRFYLLKQ
jgi:precorrin-6B methylase 2